MEKSEFLEKHVFNGLQNQNDGFDSDSIYYFSESDFETVLERSEKLGIGIYGIEPWFDGASFGVKTNEDFNKKATDPRWYKRAFTEFKKSNNDLLYAATYRVSAKLLARNPVK